MAEKEQKIENRKSPALASIISAIFPGAGFFYIGHYLKGVVYLIIFFILIMFIVSSAEYHSRALEIVVYGLLMAGFYIFQVIDSFNTARETGGISEDSEVKHPKEEISLFGSILILFLGIIFLLVNLDIISMREVVKLWPLILIAMGIKIVIGYFIKEEADE